MFHLRDFFHHPSIRAIIEHIHRIEPGLILVSGGEGLPHPDVTAHLGLAPGDALLPSGRGVIFRAVLEELLEANPTGKVVYIAAPNPGNRTNRQKRGQMTTLTIRESAEVPAAVRAAAARKPDLLLVETLTPPGLQAVLDAAAELPVLAQIESSLPASAVPQAFTLSGPAGWHTALRWVLAVQRLPAQCSHCQVEQPPTPEERAWLDKAFAVHGVLSDQPTYDGPFFIATGCANCQGSGRSGDVALLEVYYHAPDRGQPEALLTYESAIWQLVQSKNNGKSQLSLSDLIFWQAAQNQRAYQALSRMQQALEISLKSQQEQRAEIEAAQRVLEQRTQALFSLQSLGQALISSDDLAGLGKRICRRAAELCGGELAVLYYVRQPDQAEVIAVSGWAEKAIGKFVPASGILNWSRAATAAPFQGIPPGLEESLEESAAPLQGLYVPLITQNGRVGAMVLQSVKPKVFQPGEVALLQTFANQAALVLQRADLVEALLTKIKQLEDAQAGLASKERLEREMELASQVQQSVLPRSFPEAAGLAFAVRYEAARQVGGDFYDVIALPGGQIGVAVADVSDKGMPAALYMALTRSLLLAEAQRQGSPAQVLVRVNQLLDDLGSSGMFVTIFYAILDPSTGTLRYARAGQDRPVVLRKGSVRELEGRGLPLGIFTGDEFYLEEHSVKLEPGDRLVMYSDGLTDAHAPGGELFEKHRLLKLLAKNAHLSAQALCDTIFQSVLEHQQGGSPFDDMTLLVVQVK